MAVSARGKSSGNRKHRKIDKLPPEMKATVEEMILDGQRYLYRDRGLFAGARVQPVGFERVPLRAGIRRNLQTLQIAQANFRNMLDELERYPDLDTTEALVRVRARTL